MDNEASPAVGGAASDSRKRKAPSSRPSSAKKTTVSKRKTGKVVYSNDGDSLQEAGSSTELLQADRDDSLDVDDEEDDEDDAADSKAGGASSSKAKPSKYAFRACITISCHTLKAVLRCFRPIASSSTAVKHRIATHSESQDSAKLLTSKL